MFRAAAVVHLLFGFSAVWRYALTQYAPSNRLLGTALGAGAVVVGVLLLKPVRFVIAPSAIGAGLVAICAAVAAPIMRGPVIFAFALVALVCGLYAVFALRALRSSPP